MSPSRSVHVIETYNVQLPAGHNYYHHYWPTFRSLMPALSTAGRDIRLPDGSKIRIICHKVAVQVILQNFLKFFFLNNARCVYHGSL